MNNRLLLGKWILNYENHKVESEYIDFPWKLDAFKCLISVKETNFNYEDEEVNSLYEIPNINVSKLYKEQNGFFYYDATKDSNENTFITLRRNNNDEIVLSYKINSEWNNWKLVYDVTRTNGRYAFEFLMRIFAFSVLNHGGQRKRYYNFSTFRNWKDYSC